MKIDIRRILNILVFALILGFTVTNVTAQDWRVLGLKAATKRSMTDSITVKPKQGAIRRIKFRSALATVRISNVVVDYRNGKSERISFDGLIAPNSESQAFDLRGRARDVKRINFTYVALSFRGRNALISVYGQTD